MIWLLGAEALIGMLLVMAASRTRDARRRFASEGAPSRGIHLVEPPRIRRVLVIGRVPVRRSVRQLFSTVVVFGMRQFAIRILGAQWRPRQEALPVLMHPYADRIRR